MAGFGNSTQKTKKQTILKNGPQLLEAAVRAHKTGDIINAESLYLKIINSGFHHEIAFSNLGVIYKTTGRREKAIAIYERAIAENQNFVDAYTNLGNLYKDLGSVDKALAFTLKSLDLKPDNPTAHMNLGSIYKELGNLDQALASTLKSLDLKPDNPTAYMNLGGIYKELGNLDQALASTLKSLDLKPDNPTAHMNLGSIYKDLGNIDQALSSTLKSLDLKPDNPTAHMNLGGIYKELGNLDQALASTLKSLDLKPEGSQALCKLGLIKIALGQTKEARRDLFNSIKYNDQECEAYYALSTTLETKEEAEELVDLMKSVKISALNPQMRTFAEFALSNCFHKSKKHDSASKCLKLANQYKLLASPSNAEAVLQKIVLSISHFEPSKTTNTNSNSGYGRIFIVGMPRSGSTLLETILSMNPEIKDLGESRSLHTAIARIQKQAEYSPGNQTLNELYSQMEPLDGRQYKYSTDKNLYNFFHINWIATHMPAAKIIHCRRNPMDNILSMYRSNLMTGNNYTANLEETAKVLVAQDHAMETQKKRHPEKIFTFDYDQFVNAPEHNLRKLLGWLDLEFDDNYLHPEKSTRSVNTASVMQARKPISSKSVGGWKNYESLLKPALKIIQESGIKID